ncbi:MAG: NPCBM/NEW2 domain-containing protein [Rikenellaceae bacterium]
MKYFLTILLSILSIGVNNLRAQNTYLVDSHTPIDSYRYTAYKSTSSQRIAMSGGLEWRGGFTLYCTVGPYRAGYATFDLGGGYDKLLFVLGTENYGRGAGGSGIAVDPSLVTVHADGRKILDNKVYPYGIPERIELDVNGVKELKFSIIQGDGYIAIGEATLWRAGQNPVETGNIITSTPKTVELVKDIQPYFKNRHFESVSPSSNQKSLKINTREYEYGFTVDMAMAVIGDNPGWAYFNLRKQYSKLSFVVGPVDNANNAGSGWLMVQADGKTIYELETSYDDIAQVVTLDVTGCEMLTFYTEQENLSSRLGLAQIMAYPEGVVVEDSGAIVDSRLTQLPDACKLISNIPPYATGSLIDQQIFDGSSDHITFSMGGRQFSEGIVLFEKANLANSNTSSYAIFDLAGEFDYISFTAGYIGKSGAMTNDKLRLFADDEMIFEIPLIATYPNQDYVVPLNKCHKLRIENIGSSNLDVGAFGVGDLVVYRGEVVTNSLFPRTIPDCPDEIDLIDLGAPYIHYVSPMKDDKDKIFYDGSTIREYFDLGGERIYKGFMLQTSVHFSLDFGVFYNEDEPAGGSQGAAAGAIGGMAVGSAFVAGGVAVGGAVVGSTLIGAAALLMLAAGGTAMESSVAAFNTYGQYNSVTFTVACCNPYNHNSPDSYKETLLIGADQKEVAKIAIYETMEPQTITVPIDGCEQLLFMLVNTGEWSGQYIFYDIKLSKQTSTLELPKDARLSQAIISEPLWSQKQVSNQWERPSNSGGATVDAYLLGVSNAYSRTLELMKSVEPDYEIHTYYLETSAGQMCKAVNLQALKGDNIPSFINQATYCQRELESLQELKSTLTNLSISQANAMLGLPELGFKAISYGKIVRAANRVVSECSKLVGLMIDEKNAETAFLSRLLNNAIDIDGKQSSDKTIFSPLSGGEVPPSDMLQLVENFDAK